MPPRSVSTGGRSLSRGPPEAGHAVWSELRLEECAGLSGTLACPLVYLSNLPAEVDQRPWEESVREAVPSPKLWFSEEWDEVNMRGRVN